MPYIAIKTITPCVTIKSDVMYSIKNNVTSFKKVCNLLVNTDTLTGFRFN